MFQEIEGKVMMGVVPSWIMIMNGLPSPTGLLVYLSKQKKIRPWAWHCCNDKKTGKGSLDNE